MPTEVQISNRKYFDQLYNGLALNQNTGEFALLPQANIGETVKFTAELKLSWYARINSYRISGGDTIECSSADFLFDGFYEGQSIRYNSDPSNLNVSGNYTITFVSKNTMVVTPATLTDGENIATQEPDLIRGLEQQTGLVTKYGLIENGEVFNNRSKLDQITQTFYNEDITGAFSTAESKGELKNWVTGDFKIRFAGFSLDNQIIEQFNSIQNFEIEQTFIWLPYFRDGEITNLVNKLPPVDIFKGDKSLKHSLRFEFRDDYPNLNTSKVAVNSETLGTVGWFGENFNGFNSFYSVSNVVYTNLDTGLSSSSLIKGKNIRVNFEVYSTLAHFSITDPILFYFSLLPSFDTYGNRQEEYRDVWQYQNILVGINEAPVSNGDFVDAFASTIDASNLSCQFDFQLSSDQEVDVGSNYMFWTLVGDTSIASQQSNRANEIIDVNTYEVDTDIAGQISNDYIRIFPHPVDLIEDDPTEGFSDIKTNIETGFVCSFGFDLNRDLDPIIDNSQIRFFAYNSTTQEEFDLQVIPYDISNDQLNASGSQFIDIDLTRGYPLAVGDQNNNFRFQTGGYDSGGNNQSYYGSCGVKPDWQEWLSLPNADAIFFDTNEPNNGLNRNSSRYSLQEGYAIKVALDIFINNEGNITKYSTYTPDFEIYDYGQGPLFTCTQETFRGDGTPLEGNIIQQDETTFLRATFVPTGGPISDINDYYGIIRIHEKELPSYSNNELSSVRLPPDNNIILPLEGDDLLSITLDSGNIVLECRVDPNQLNTNVSYDWKGFIDLKDSSTISGAYSSGYSDGYD